MYLHSVAVVFSLLTLPQAAQTQQQPYHDWTGAYGAAEELVSSWTIQQRANITIRNGQAPGYLPFTPADGTNQLIFSAAVRTG